MIVMPIALIRLFSLFGVSTSNTVNCDIAISSAGYSMVAARIRTFCPAGTFSDQRLYSLNARSIDRFASFFAISARLSYCFFPLATPISTFTSDPFR